MSEQRTLGKYELQAAIGKGPRGAVYRAVHAETKRAVALKVYAADALRANALESFRKYAPLLARVRHPGIAGFIELVEAEGRVAIAWELFQGTPLSALLKDGAYPEPKKAWDIIRLCVEALAHVHQQGAVHRDIKPSNILVTAEGGVVITDVAVAKMYAQPHGVEYFSPEHFARESITSRSDVYQMGVLVYQLVTGKLPFTGTPAEIEHRVAQERATDPSSYNKHLAWQLDWVVQKALSKEPGERQAAVIDFSNGVRLGLQDTVGRALPEARPPTPPTPATVTPLQQNAKVLSAKPAAPAPAPSAAPAKPETPAAAAPAATPAVAKPAAAPAPPPRPAGPAATPVPKPAAVSPTPAQANALAASAAAIVKPQPAKPAAPPAAVPAAAAVPAPKPAAPPAAPTPSAAAVPPAAAKPGILFVDDDPRILTSLKALLRQEYNVQTAERGADAIEILKQGGIDVIVSDQRMPEMTGVELLRQVRVFAPNVVRVLLTGYTDLASLVGSINEGEIFRFVMKPWDNDELKAALAEAFTAAKALQAPQASPAKPEAPRSAGSLLVIDRTEGVAKGLERLLAGEARVIRVETPAEAAKVISREEVAALVADMGSGMDGLVALFREVKAKRPGVLSILLTDEPDSELAIELINRAQIFRLLPKPVSARDLRTQVADALRRYAVFKQRVAAAASAVGDGAGALAHRPVAGTG